MRKFTIILLMFIGLGIQAQSLETPALQNYIEGMESQQLMPYHAVDGHNTAADVSTFLLSNLLGNYAAGTHLKLEYERTSPDGVYYTYGLYFNNVAIYGRTAKVFLDKSNTIRWLHHNFSSYKAPIENTFLSEEEIKAFAQTRFATHQWVNGASVWANTGKEIIPAFYVTLKNTEEYSVNQYLYNTAGNLLYINAIDKRFAADTPVYGYVFNPDPLTTAQKLYGGAYSFNDSEEMPLVLAERKKVLFDAGTDGDSVILANDHFFIGEVSIPTWPATKVAIGDTFKYTLLQHQFAEVNAFYHLNMQHKHIKSMGYNLPTFKIKVDAHAFAGGDDSRFTYSDVPPTLQFGDGGVPDAQDADVLVHELSHALSSSASPNTAVGLERRAMEEGQADYFAASYSWPLGTFHWQKVFTWDGNNGGWQGRSVEYNGSYDKLSNNIWTDGQLLSTAFMRLFRMIGKEKTDKLMLEALYRFNSNMSMPQFAEAVKQVDSIKNSGVNAERIQCAFASVDILDSLSACVVLGIEKAKAQKEQKLVQVYNSWGFAQNGEDITLVFANPANYEMIVFDATGKLISFEEVNGNAYKKIWGQNFAPGIYLLQVRDKQTGIVQTEKLLRY